MSLKDRIKDVLVPRFTPALLRLTSRQDYVGEKARKLLVRQQERLVQLHGPASSRDFETRLADLGPGDIAFDLGANLGIYTEKLAATGADVHAFEPDPHCFAQLETRFSGTPNVFLHAKAVSDRAGHAMLHRKRNFLNDPDLYSTSSSIATGVAGKYFEGNVVEVETIAFDSLVRSFDRPISLIKMDIEGAEFAILDQILADQAAGRVLPIKALFVETHERNFPERIAMVMALRAANAAGKLPYPIDTYWP